MTQNACLKTYEIESTHSIPGRARLKIEELRNNEIFCKKLTDEMSRLNGIFLTSSNKFTAKMLIIYDPNVTGLHQINKYISKYLNSYKQLAKLKNINYDTNIKYKKVLSLEEFKNSKNALSNQYREFNSNAIAADISGVRSNKLWHTYTAEDTLKALKSDLTAGLTNNEADLKLENYGPNQFTETKKQTFIANFLKQFDGFIIKLLLAASGASILLGQFVDAASILIILVLEASLGVWQEIKAERSLESLKTMAAPTAKVIRNSSKIDITANKLVPGDIIYVEAGDIVPADARIIESCGLEVTEASLTGESYPVCKKNVSITDTNVILGDRINMLYSGTHVVKGKGKAIVVTTGMNTEMGTVAAMLGNEKPEKTPLQKDLNSLSKIITYCCIGVCISVTLAGIIGGHPLTEMFATGISLAVGAIPEGLTTVLTISLAFGAQRMAKKKAIIKDLPSMETLSCAKVICTDKTGTLTTNEMTVKQIYTLNNTVEVTGDGYNTNGDFLKRENKIADDLKMLLTSAVLCNNAQISPSENKTYRIKGDPTEAALLIAAEKSGLHLDDFKCYKREHEIPFDPENKKMTAVCSNEEGNYFSFSKGAIDVIINKCNRISNGNSIEKLNEEHIQKLNSMNNEMADKAYRILALSYKPLSEKPEYYESYDLEEDMIFLGLVGIMDPPRPGVKEAIKKCHAAGIKVVMITGDHKNTATAIARSIDLLEENGIVLCGEEIEKMGDEALSAIVDKVQVFSRTCPKQKLKIVRAFRRKGYIVAMTGDGINDAPALKEANIGIAMGRNGTDVTRDAASIILSDDNFNTIVKAVEEGRTINRNIRKFLKYVLSGNLAEVLVIFLASISGIPTPLIPAQILMLNLVTEGIPALSLGVDPPEENIMNEPSRDQTKSIFDNKMRNRIVIRGIATGLTTLGVFGSTLIATGNLVKARTISFANLVSCQMLHAFECSSMGVRRNKYLLPSVIISSGIMLASIYVPGLRTFLGMSPLNALDWTLVLLSALTLSRINDFINDIMYLARLRQRPSFGI